MNSSNPLGVYAWIKSFLSYKEGREIIQEEKSNFMKGTAIAAVFAGIIFLTIKF